MLLNTIAHGYPWEYPTALNTEHYKNAKMFYFNHVVLHRQGIFCDQGGDFGLICLYYYDPIR